MHESFLYINNYRHETARSSDVVAGKFNIVTISVRGNYAQKWINKTSEGKGKIVLVIN
jgi:hypothetical protein